MNINDLKKDNLLQVIDTIKNIAHKETDKSTQNTLFICANYLKGIYNSFAEFVGLEPIDMTPRVDETNLQENKEKIEQLKEDMIATDIGGALFGTGEDQIDTIQELSDAVGEVVTNLGEQIIETKKAVNPKDPEASLIVGATGPSEEELVIQESSFERHKKSLKKMTEGEKKIYTDARKDWRTNLEIAGKEFKAFNEANRAIKMTEIAMNIPTTVSKAYESGLTPPGPFAIARAAIYGATALAAQLAQLRQLKKAATGYEGMVSSPTMFLAGERGAENVSVTPLDAPNIRGPQGGEGQNIVINFEGNVMEEEYITETAIPMIRDAIRRGAEL